MLIKIFLILLTYNAVPSNGANILFVTPIPSPSHHILQRTLALGLVERGHNVTMLTHEIEKNELPKNFTVITMKGVYEEIYKSIIMNDYGSAGITQIAKIWYDINLNVVKCDHSTEGFKTLWNYPKDFKFDLIVYDSSVGRFMYVFTERFGYPPSIALTSFNLALPLAFSFGSLPFTVYDPFYATTYTDNMNLMERIYNIYYTYYDILYCWYVHYPAEQAVVTKYYPKIESTLEELENRLSLILCNTDPVLDFPRIFPPNIIPVGGLHARPSRPLPQDLQKIMDAAKSGVILFSLGTNVKSDELGAPVIKSLLASFSKLKQTVLWKFESDLYDVPKNVIVRKWLPQNDIMGHPNTKIFINHGGAHSTLEALYHGLPIIIIPFFADQNINAVKVTTKKVGVMVDKYKLNGEVLVEAINEILNTDMYTKNMKALSAKFHDQPLNALDRAIFWVEYLLRHGNADHLSVPTRRLPVYKILHLDIIAIFISIILLAIFSIRCIYTKLFHRKIKEKLKAN